MNEERVEFTIDYNNHQDNTIKFFNNNNEEIGVLYLDDIIYFEGKADESAKIFMEYLTTYIKACKEKIKDNK